MVGLGMPVLDGEASMVSFGYVTRREPLGVTKGALVLCGSAGRSRDDARLFDSGVPFVYSVGVLVPFATTGTGVA